MRPHASRHCVFIFRAGPLDRRHRRTEPACARLPHTVEARVPVHAARPHHRREQSTAANDPQVG
jgi:hypothetical protein